MKKRIGPLGLSFFLAVGLGVFPSANGATDPTTPNNTHTFHRPQDFIQSLAGDPKAGEKVFNHFCVSCHGESPVIPLGAPRIGHRDDWQAISQKPFTDVMKIVYEGNGPMPARGGCFECSDELLQATVRFMMGLS